MPTDFDNLIRSAKPAVPASTRERVLEYVGAGGAAASAPALFRVFSRVAALVVLGVISGIAAAMLAPERETGADPLPGLRAQRAELEARLGRVEADSPAARLARLELEVAQLEQADAALETAIVDAISARELKRVQLWRERHIQHVREHHERATEVTVQRLRDELGLTETQEAEVRALLAEAGQSAEALIGESYGRRRHYGVHEKFEQLAAETDEKLKTLLDDQQRKRLDRQTGLVSSEPEDWAPSSEFRDGTDLDVYMNWMTVSRE